MLPWLIFVSSDQELWKTVRTGKNIPQCCTCYASKNQMHLSGPEITTIISHLCNMQYFQCHTLLCSSFTLWHNCQCKAYYNLEFEMALHDVYLTSFVLPHHTIPLSTTTLCSNLKVNPCSEIRHSKLNAHHKRSNRQHMPAEMPANARHHIGCCAMQK